MNSTLEQANIQVKPGDCCQVGILKLPIDEKTVESNSNQNIIAMACFPSQKTIDSYDPEEGVIKGTIFKSLDMPFYGIGGKLL